MDTVTESLTNAKPYSQVFACLVSCKHNLLMEIEDEIVKIRRKNLKLWFSDKQIPGKEKSYISQLINEKASFREKAARRLENTYGMPKNYLDTDHENQIPSIDLSKMSMGKLQFIKEIENMSEDDFRAKSGAFQALAGIETNRAKSNNN